MWTAITIRTQVLSTWYARLQAVRGNQFLLLCIRKYLECQWNNSAVWYPQKPSVICLYIKLHLYPWYCWLLTIQNRTVLPLWGFTTWHWNWMTATPASLRYICEACKLQPYLRLAGCLYTLHYFFQYPFTTASVSQSLEMALLGQKAIPWSTMKIFADDQMITSQGHHFCSSLFEADIQSITEFLLHCTVPTKSNSTHWMNLGKLRLKKPAQSDVSPVFGLEVGEKWCS